MSFRCLPLFHRASLAMPRFLLEGFVPSPRRALMRQCLSEALMLLTVQAQRVCVFTVPHAQPKRDIVSDAELIREPSYAMGIFGFMARHDVKGRRIDGHGDLRLRGNGAP
jgi:hypothetical protein